MELHIFNICSLYEIQSKINERNSLQVLNFPICTPSMLVQLYSNGTDQQNIIEKRNCDLISEAYEISDIFNHDSIIVNLLNFNDSSFIIKTLLIYFETFFKK